MLILVFAFVGWVLYSLVYVPSLVFWPKWPRVLVIDESSGPLECLCWGFGYLGSLDLVWLPVKLKFSWVFRSRLDFSNIKFEYFSGVPKTSLPSIRAARVVVLNAMDPTWANGICSSNWCGLCLSLWSVLVLWGRATCWLVRVLWELVPVTYIRDAGCSDSTGAHLQVSTDEGLRWMNVCSSNSLPD